MKTLVIDKSVLIAAPQGLLKGLDCSFLLTDTLLHEIGTESLGKREDLSEADESRLDGRIRATFKRAVEEGGNGWVDRESALRWEVERGLSAASQGAPRLRVVAPELPDMTRRSSDMYDQCMKYEGMVGDLGSTVHAPGDEKLFQRLRRLTEYELFQELRRDFCSPEGRARIAIQTKDVICQGAKERGWQIAPSFDPGPSWLAFGMILSKMVFLQWKFWRHPDEPAHRRKPANPWFDMEYIAYMAIADGLLSMDKNQLKLAWACWPEKEAWIWWLNKEGHAISQFEPEWSC